jgi:hypothetical protein
MVQPMKCLDETPEEIARRMRALADGVTNPADAQAIRAYASWIERTGNLDLMEAREPDEADNEDDAQEEAAHLGSKQGAERS